MMTQLIQQVSRHSTTRHVSFSSDATHLEAACHFHSRNKALHIQTITMLLQDAASPTCVGHVFMDNLDMDDLQQQHLFDRLKQF